MIDIALLKGEWHDTETLILVDTAEMESMAYTVDILIDELKKANGGFLPNGIDDLQTFFANFK